jgi:glyoxylase-like metal-dependent hydrolase (beta-lactamase superfamily II)
MPNKNGSDMSPLSINPPEAGSLVALADDLYWMRFTLPFRLNHINLYAFDTKDGWLLLDCGINSEAIANQWAMMLKGPLAGRPICGIIVSHYHADHVGYAGNLAKITSAPVYMGAVEHEQASWGLAQSDEHAGGLLAKTYARFGLNDEVINRVRQEGNYYRKLAGDLPDVTIIETSQQFETKSGCWLTRFDTGHSPGHMSLSDFDRKLHICVDFLLPRISPNISVSLRSIELDMLGHYYTYLSQMLSLDNEWLIIPGHDWPYFGGGIRAAELIEHHNSRLELLREAASNAGPLSTADAMRILFAFDLTDHELYFASCEARAHLNHLVTRDEMRIEQVAGIDYFHNN